MGRQSRRIKIAGRPRKRPIEHDADCFTPDMAQCRSVIPKLSITWDEGVAKPVIDLAKRMLRLYHRHADAIYVCYRMYIKAWHKQTKPLFSEHEMATYRLQTVLAARLAEAALANAVWHPCQQGVVSQLGDRSISIHLASLTRMNVRGWGMQFQPRRPPASQVGPAPLPYYSEHFLDRWRERAVGTTMEDRSYIGWWDLMGAIHDSGNNLRFTAQYQQVRAGYLFKTLVRFGYGWIDLGYAAVEFLPCSESEAPRLVFKTFMTTPMVEEPQQPYKLLPHSGPWRISRDYRDAYNSLISNILRSES